jgi:hypothetical protein
MVHALDEIHRVLTPGGILVDLRPLADSWPVEVLQGESSVVTGRLIDLPTGLGDDLAANAAIAEAVLRGWFRFEKVFNFRLYEYWDDPDEMIAYISERWADLVLMSDDLQNNTRTAWNASGAGSRLRLKLTMLLTSWRKL